MQRRFQRLEQPQIFLLLQNRQRFRRKIRRDDDLAENFRDGLRARAVERRFTAMMPPNGACLSVANALSHASRRVRALPDAARIRVLENRQRRRVVREFGDQIRRRRQIQNVVVGKFLAVKLLEKFVEFAVKRRLLVRIFTVTQRLRQRRGNR